MAGVVAEGKKEECGGGEEEEEEYDSDEYEARMKRENTRFYEPVAIPGHPGATVSVSRFPGNENFSIWDGEGICETVEGVIALKSGRFAAFWSAATLVCRISGSWTRSPTNSSTGA